ncbi:hypothetical protein A2118_01835 [Candidatus Kaiserbacteria bacterium GWA2_50_9]|uniref:Uncharacterized protein n=1 Tax=Candidatus Kaiserbacteria bacterium GWA2_50_9 TaxID=1798474 RepID=A0A1F6BS48_9BACT|nr:MAG: hypothetical protein A2118_01835 [Candidatus Kaiserbacteria bacterium GWA2_50_9]
MLTRRKFVVGALGSVAALRWSVVSAAEEWTQWGISPFATSQADACKKASAAIDGFSMPEAVKTAFKQKLGATCGGGVEVWLTPGMLLEQMWTGGHKPHVMDKKKVGELPVLKSPEGRPYRKGAVAETAKALSWTVVHEGKLYTLYLPLVCFNWSWAFDLATVFAPVGQCPDVYTLKINVWEHKALTLPGVEATHANEEYGTRLFSDAKVSRKHGRQFRIAYKEGKLQRSAVEHAFRVSFIMTPEAQGGSSEITKEEPVGDVAVTGLRELQFTRAQLNQWDAIRVVAVNGDVTSPPAFNGTGLKENRYFNHLPGKKLGEWENNPVPDCIMNEHWIE